MNIPKKPIEYTSPLESMQGKRLMFRPDEIEGLICEDNFIMLVKIYREISGKGLREAKEAIDTCCEFKSVSHHRTIIREKIWALYLQCDIFSSYKLVDDRLLEDIKNVLKDYKAMGYSTPLKQLRIVIEAYEAEYAKLTVTEKSQPEDPPISNENNEITADTDIDFMTLKF